MTARRCVRQGVQRAIWWLFVSVASSPAALAWNAGGHRVVAMIAWEAMDTSTRSAAAKLLRAHPDFLQWQERSRDADADADLTAFLEASTWPDDIRRDKRFYTAGLEAPTPTLAGFPDMERRLDWHYVDLPVGSAVGKAGTDGELDRQLVELADTVGNRQASTAARAYALPWLLHLVGDAHQPLHTASRAQPDGRSDNGGNEQPVVNPFDQRHPSTNLHRYWDDLPAPPWLRGSRLESAVRALNQGFRPPLVAGVSAQWIEESRQLARDQAYPPGRDEVPTIDSQFHENALALARQRMIDAGYRLADLLHRLLGGK